MKNTILMALALMASILTSASVYADATNSSNDSLISINSKPVGASVYIYQLYPIDESKNYKYIGVTPVNISVTGNASYMVILKLEGYVEWSSLITVGINESAYIEPILTKKYTEIEPALKPAINVSGNGTKYDFDEVNVLYAVSFDASPETNQARSGISQEEWYGADQSWLKDLITGSNPNITVLFGVVELKKEGSEPFKEEFIKISGERGSRRFLLNSQQFEYYEGNSLKQIYSFFWSAKRLEDRSIIKDFTEPVDSVIFMRKLQPSGEATNFYLSFFSGAEKAQQSYNTMTFPIMYSLYKPIAEFGEASETVKAH